MKRFSISASAMAPVALALLLWVGNHSSAFADAITVTSMDDSGPGTLREAINGATAGALIVIPNDAPSILTLNSGELLVNRDLTIAGTGQGNFIISGTNLTRVLHVAGGATVTLSNVMVLRGKSDAAGGGILNEVSCALSLCNCAISKSTSTINGGGIANYGTLILNNCTLSGNTVNFGDGGGIYNLRSSLCATNCTFYTNKANSGGAIYNDSGSVNLQNCTLALNYVGTDGGGVFSRDSLPAVATNFVASTIIAHNRALSAQNDLTGKFISGGYNLIGVRPTPSGFDSVLLHDQYGAAAAPLDPMLTLLQNNGGPTLTMALLPGSPAIDNGKAAGLAADQRGWPRPNDDLTIPNPLGGDGSDIGAFESGPYLPRLTMQISAFGTTLSWTTNAQGFGLQFANDLSLPNPWFDFAQLPGQVGDQYSLTDTNSPGNVFYRLKAP